MQRHGFDPSQTGIPYASGHGHLKRRNNKRLIEAESDLESKLFQGAFDVSDCGNGNNAGLGNTRHEFERPELCGTIVV